MISSIPVWGCKTMNAAYIEMLVLVIYKFSSILNKLLTHQGQYNINIVKFKW